MSPMTYRMDTIGALSLLPFLSFMSRRPHLTRADAIELAMVILFEVRMVLSLVGSFPVTSFEASNKGAIVFASVLISLNVLSELVPALRKPF
jgi:hypothetical protein